MSLGSFRCFIEFESGKKSIKRLLYYLLQYCGMNGCSVTLELSSLFLYSVILFQCELHGLTGVIEAKASTSERL